MRLSWNEIRARAADFAREWADAAYEKSETQSFYNEFFEIFGKRRRDVARYEERVQRLDNTSGFIDLFWPGVLLVEQKSAGRDLMAAREQAGTYFDALPERERPRFQLLCDFQTFELLDRDERDETRFALADLPQHVEKFGFIIGVQRRTFRDQDPVNIEASELIARLHDALKASGYDGHDLELFLVRTVFCLFADDTGIFEPRDIFLQFIEERTAPDGADLGAWLMQLFEVLNTPVSRRQRALDEDLTRFPHVNGELFADRLRPPAFNTAMRAALLDAGQFDWTAIDDGQYIFGAEERSAFLEAEPDAAPLLRPFLGAREYLQGGDRWILALHDASPGTLAGLPLVRERIAAVRTYRRSRESKPTQRLAETPTLYHVNVVPFAPFLVIPKVSSERREYVPIGWLEPPTVPSDLVFVLLDATKPVFALLTSAMHMAWLSYFGGRLKSDYRYSIGLVYNTFPLPPGFADADTSALGPLAQAVLDARATHPEVPLADLYDPDLMPPNLRSAHRALDRAVDRLYRRKRFTSERERAEYLLALYERMRAPLAAPAAKPRARRRARRRNA